MRDIAADFEKLKKDLQAKLADIENDFPDATEDIRSCRAKVDEYCRCRNPRNDNEYFTLSQTHTLVKMGLNSTWNALNRNRNA